MPMIWVYDVRPPLRRSGILWQWRVDNMLDLVKREDNFAQFLTLQVIAKRGIFQHARASLCSVNYREPSCLTAPGLLHRARKSRAGPTLETPQSDTISAAA